MTTTRVEKVAIDLSLYVVLDEKFSRRHGEVSCLLHILPVELDQLGVHGGDRSSYKFEQWR